METFIEQVRNHPCLWDTDSVSYRDSARKDLAWKVVAQNCGLVNASEAKNQWKRLRDSHREAMRRRKTALQPQNFGPWKYEKLMEFVLPQKRETYANFCNETYTENALVSLSTEDNECNSESSTLDVEREYKRQIKEKEREEMRRQIFDENRMRRDPLSDLFSSMCEKTRDLPKYLQLRVQREIFDSVSRAEEEALSFESQVTSASYYNASSDKFGQMDICELAETKYRQTESPAPSTSVIVPEQKGEIKR
ncbi:hypothetical protein RR46_05101 [Papilio xuthus]|uniref:MADF domain-containing protein n=1 Tax=Papilio xuthus TaxID=66420 RepID=A0A194Q8M9_PAPXU|nr:hypothetical protein RR46_05101 [Papilio xuthus]